MDHDRRNAQSLLVVILNEVERLEEVLSLLVENGVRGATVVDSIGMGRILDADVPIFAGFRDLFRAARPTNRTIVSVMSAELAQEVASALVRQYGIGEPGKGICFTLPVTAYWGPGA